MDELPRVHVLDAFKDLIKDIFFVDILHDVGAYDSMQVSLHEIEDEVDVLVVFRLKEPLQGDDIGMSVELLQKNNLCRVLGTSRKVRCASVAF